MKKLKGIFRTAMMGRIWPVIFPFRSGHGNKSVERGQHSRSVIILLVFIQAGSLSSAQTSLINIDLQRINLSMFETKNLYMEIDYNLYFNDALRSQMKGIVKKKDRMLYQQVGGITVVKNKEYSVFVHADKKLLVVDPNPELKDPIRKEDLLRLNIDTLKNWLMGSELAEQNNLRIITFTLKKGEYSRIVIEYDRETYFLRKMQLYARDAHTSVDQQQYKVWMEVVFANVSANVDFPIEDFSYEKYVTIKNEENVRSTGNFRDFHLINNLPKKITYERK
jgi:hypothetical protein